MKMTFLGAAGTVTGSRYLIETGARRFLVDCGLFQGLKELRLRNREPFPVPPAKLEAVVLTHAHLDHSGYLPVLSGWVRGQSAARPRQRTCAGPARGCRADRGRDGGPGKSAQYTKHRPALPLHPEDAVRALEQFSPTSFDETSGWAATSPCDSTGRVTSRVPPAWCSRRATRRSSSAATSAARGTYPDPPTRSRRPTTWSLVDVRRSQAHYGPARGLAEVVNRTVARSARS